MSKKSFQIDAQQMRDLGDYLAKKYPGLGFALITFDFGDIETPANYISNAQREDMIKALEEVLDRWKKGMTFPTPTNN